MKKSGKKLASSSASRSPRPTASQKNLPSSVFRPSVSPQTVLVAVTGMSPAILTETVWALAHESPPVRPSRVVVFGTRKSRDQIRADLLNSGVWDRLRRTLRANPDELIFGDTGEHMRIFAYRGRELDDIRTPSDNTAAADYLLEQLRSFTENPELRVIASIAGGRKTMGALLYAAMTLIGRETDRITHVLVEEELERRREPKFMYPETAAEARQITLADVPFVPLRNRFIELGRMPGGFSTLVRHYASALRPDIADAPVRIRMDDNKLRVAVNGVEVLLNRRAYIVLRYALERNQTNRVPIGLAVDNEEFKRFVAKTGLHPEWARTAVAETDLRHELNLLRRAFDRHNILWKPGLRRDALRLPPFIFEP